MPERERRILLRQLALLGAAAVCPAWAAGFEAVPWPKGQRAPALDAVDLDGRRWRLDALRGRAVLLNFWASWCEPCRAEMPTLQQLAELYGADRLVVLAINFKESAAKAAQFARSTGLGLPVLLDPAGAAARQWGVRIFPTTVLIDAAGRPRQRVQGEVDWTSQEAARWVEPLMRP
ncbi:TlpA family protein disulfide reductase [Variovorax terrae]|uniref:TlpA family protein disulfide reductase n=1 Tax=Variovorax terrae TaxID=2923278 RepID=A0A9X1VXN7_9BURK|nr:TlpA disulfide reductase family protein [Variovorax terrae]MCJ0763892.1 TlpA family protein disulfide reductase [Variovorax terrae]